MVPMLHLTGGHEGDLPQVDLCDIMGTKRQSSSIISTGCYRQEPQMAMRLVCEDCDLAFILMKIGHRALPIRNLDCRRQHIIM